MFLFLAAMRVAQDNDWNRGVVGVAAGGVAGGRVRADGLGPVGQPAQSRTRRARTDGLSRRIPRHPAPAPGDGRRAAHPAVLRRPRRQAAATRGRRQGLAPPDFDDDVKAPKPERLHGRHVLNRYEDGMEKCIGCELCAGVCPAKCIYVRGADNDPDAPSSPGERYGYVYEINYLRCIHCDLCVEACPTEAITESKLFEFSFTNRQDAIYTKAELLVDDDGKPQRMPWEDWREGEDRNTSGWMRATSPSGDADFVGEVGWSGELGYGVRAQPSSPPTPTGRTSRRRLTARRDA